MKKCCLFFLIAIASGVAYCSEYTLSDAQISAFDWDASGTYSKQTRARVLAVDDIPGPGVKFEIGWPGDTTIEDGWVMYGSSIFGGKAKSGLIDAADVSAIVLNIKLVSVNGFDANSLEFPLTTGLFIDWPNKNNNSKTS